jgi:hypothetical protein
MFSLDRTMQFKPNKIASEIALQNRDYWIQFATQWSNIHVLQTALTQRYLVLKETAQFIIAFCTINFDVAKYNFNFKYFYQ